IVGGERAFPAGRAGSRPQIERPGSCREFFLEGLSIRRQVVRRLDRRGNSAAMVSAARPEEGFPMRFMFIVKSAHVAAPTPELLEAMHTLADQEIKAGRMLDNGGLMPLTMGAHVHIRDGQLSVVDGPFVEAKEVIGGYAVFELHSKEEAVASAVKF